MKFKIGADKQIYLKELEVGHVSEAYLGWLRDPEINEFLEVRFNPPKSLADLFQFVKNTKEDRLSFLFGIFTRSADEHVGNIKLGPVNEKHKIADIGFLIGDRRHWGKGFAFQAITQVTDFAFSQLGLFKVTAGCYSNNEGSRRALIKAGFKEEGKLIQHWQFGEERVDGYVFGKTSGH